MGTLDGKKTAVSTKAWFQLSPHSLAGKSDIIVWRLQKSSFPAHYGLRKTWICQCPKDNKRGTGNDHLYFPENVTDCKMVLCIVSQSAFSYCI
jgi:hypothetical protein